MTEETASQIKALRIMADGVPQYAAVFAKAADALERLARTEMHLREWASNLQACIAELEAERDAIRAKTIEEIHQIVEREFRQADALRAIRALAAKPSEDEDKP